ICDEADESESKLKQRIAELEKQVSTRKVPDEKSRPEIPPPRLLDALGHNARSVRFNESLNAVHMIPAVASTLPFAEQMAKKRKAEAPR
uniref:MT domain-containing protein n=1 Tax=Haemonchus contortus TaxID=6289 RepID=A0A7I5ED36_HAECO